MKRFFFFLLIMAFAAFCFVPQVEHQATDPPNYAVASDQDLLQLQPDAATLVSAQSMIIQWTVEAPGQAYHYLPQYAYTAICQLYKPPDQLWVIHESIHNNNENNFDRFISNQDTQTACMLVTHQYFEYPYSYSKYS